MKKLLLSIWAGVLIFVNFSVGNAAQVSVNESNVQGLYRYTNLHALIKSVKLSDLQRDYSNDTANFAEWTFTYQNLNSDEVAGACAFYTDGDNLVQGINVVYSVSENIETTNNFIGAMLRALSLNDEEITRLFNGLDDLGVTAVWSDSLSKRFVLQLNTLDENYKAITITASDIKN